MLSHLYHAPVEERPWGMATVGCTEACILSGLAAKKLWQQRCRAKNAPCDKPNLVVGSHFQVLLAPVNPCECQKVCSWRRMSLASVAVCPMAQGVLIRLHYASCANPCPSAHGALRWLPGLPAGNFLLAWQCALH
jgi:hypothetical protein